MKQLLLLARRFRSFACIYFNPQQVWLVHRRVRNASRDLREFELSAMIRVEELFLCAQDARTTVHSIRRLLMYLMALIIADRRRGLMPPSTKQTHHSQRDDAAPVPKQRDEEKPE